MPFISFACFIMLASILSAVLNRSGKRSHPSLVLVLCGNLHFIKSQLAEVFFLFCEQVLNFKCKMFFLYLLRWSCVLFICLLIWSITLTDFGILSQLIISEGLATWLWCVTFYILDSPAKIWSTLFFICVYRKYLH